MDYSHIENIKKVGVLKSGTVKMSVIQNSDFFSMIDAIDDVIALAWESDDENLKKRMIFRFGTPEQEIKDKLYEKDLLLEFEKKVVYEN